MYCTQCGTRIDDAARFCMACGKAVGAAPNAGATQAGTAANQALPPNNGWANAAEPPKKLRRIRADKKIAGVCAGFAEYFDMDVTIMRLIWVALLILPPSIGLIAYVVAWIVLPVS